MYDNISGTRVFLLFYQYQEGDIVDIISAVISTGQYITNRPQPSPLTRSGIQLVFVVSLSVCLFVCLSIFLSLSLYLSMYLYLSIYLPTYLSIYIYACLSIYISIYISARVTIYLSIYLSIYISARVTIYLPMYVFYLSIYLPTSLPPSLSLAPSRFRDSILMLLFNLYCFVLCNTAVVVIDATDQY